MSRGSPDEEPILERVLDLMAWANNKNIAIEIIRLSHKNYMDLLVHFTLQSDVVDPYLKKIDEKFIQVPSTLVINTTWGKVLVRQSEPNAKTPLRGVFNAPIP